MNIYKKSNKMTYELRYKKKHIFLFTKYFSFVILINILPFYNEMVELI